MSPAIASNKQSVMRRANIGVGVEVAVATATFSDIAESEREFLIVARQVTQQRIKANKKADERDSSDITAIEDIAALMVEMTDEVPGHVCDFDRQKIAELGELPLSTVNRLWKDATWLALDELADDNGIGDRTPRERELRIAYAALASPEAVHARVNGLEPPYSGRQKNLVRRDSIREEFMQKVKHEQNPERFSQSAWSRVNDGYPWLRAGRVGGATQADGQGKYLNLPFVEKGYRSNTAKGATLKRLVAATPKVGSRRRGINDPKKVERILCLDSLGKDYAEIAADVGEKPSRVKAVIWDAENDCVFRSGLTNDSRFAHLKKYQALDQIHGNLRVDCKDVFRPVDYDHDFADVFELIEFINQRKVKPQWVTWDRDDARPGVVQHPQFLFALPEGSGVWYGEHKASAMLEAVAAAICADYGGDPGGLANIFDTKLPTSPHCEFICPESEHLPTLSELCRIYDVDLRNDLTRTARQMTVQRMVDAGIDETVSMSLYSLFWKRGWEIAERWERAGDLRIGPGMNRALFRDRLFNELLVDRFIVAELAEMDDRQRAGTEKSLNSAARNVSAKYGKNQRRVSGRGYDIGAAEAETKMAVEAARLAGKDEINAAQGAGQDYARRQRNDRTRRKIADHMFAAITAGREPTFAMIAKSTGMDPRTVKKRWDEAVALLGDDCILISAVSATTDMPVDTAPVANVEKPANAVVYPPANSSTEWGVTLGCQQSNLRESSITALPGQLSVDDIIKSGPLRRIMLLSNPDLFTVRRKSACEGQIGRDRGRARQAVSRRNPAKTYEPIVGRHNDDTRLWHNSTRTLRSPTNSVHQPAIDRCQPELESGLTRSSLALRVAG